MGGLRHPHECGTVALGHDMTVWVGCRWRHAQVGPGNTAVLERGIQEVARKYAMDWRVSFATKQKRMALLVRCVGGV